MTRDALLEGASAFDRGTPCGMNPYVGDPERWLEWRAGWDEAKASAARLVQAGDPAEGTSAASGGDPVYRSPNGDDWLLRTDAATGRIGVVHRPPPSSGDAESVTPVDEFLERGGHAPETEAVRRALERTDS